MTFLKVDGLCKRYEKFYLDNVSFRLDKGYIMGFIGANGAGKTTTLKGILNLIHTDNGEVEIFGEKMGDNHLGVKQDISFMTGGSDYYPKRKLKTISSVVSQFYSNWDWQDHNRYLRRFSLDPEKKVVELSKGMRIKFALTLALSHKSRLIILDEPTSGLDPVARDDLLELLQELVETGERSVLFSTHITSDLEKSADYITFINNGRILASETKDDFMDLYRIVTGSAEVLENIKDELISFKTNSFGFSGLTFSKKAASMSNIQEEKPSLDDIMIYHARMEDKNERI